jgi:hypothetical protein
MAGRGSPYKGDDIGVGPSRGGGGGSKRVSARANAQIAKYDKANKAKKKAKGSGRPMLKVKTTYDATPLVAGAAGYVVGKNASKSEKPDMRSPLKQMKAPSKFEEYKRDGKSFIEDIKVETKDQKAKRILREMAAKKKSKGKKQPKGKSMAPGEYAPRKTKKKVQKQRNNK